MEGQSRNLNSPICEVQGDEPKRLVVVDLAPESSATRFYGISADYGWCQRILFGGAYLNDANDIARALAEAIGPDVEIEYGVLPDPAAA